MLMQLSSANPHQDEISHLRWPVRLGWNRSLLWRVYAGMAGLKPREMYNIWIRVKASLLTASFIFQFDRTEPMSSHFLSFNTFILTQCPWEHLLPLYVFENVWFGSVLARTWWIACPSRILSSLCWHGGSRWETVLFCLLICVFLSKSSTTCSQTPIPPR